MCTTKNSTKKGRWNMKDNMNIVSGMIWYAVRCKSMEKAEKCLIYNIKSNMSYLNSRGPVPVLVMSLLFIASVFMLHIWGKYTRS